MLNHGRHNMLLLMVAYFISSAGNWIFKFATPLYIFAASGSAKLMALAYAAQFLPVVLFSLFVGYISDRFDNKKLLLTLDLTGFLLCLALYTAWSDTVSHDLFVFYSFIVASITTTYHALFQGALPMIFDEKTVSDASARVAFIDSFFPVLGPALGAIVAAAISYESALLLTAIGFLLSWLLTRFISFKSNDKQQKRSVVKTIKHGMAAMLASRFLTFSVVRFFLAGIGLNCFVAVFVFYLKEQYQLSDYEVVLVFSLSFVGLFLGRKLANVIYKKRLDKELVLTCSGMITGLCVYYFSNHISLWEIVITWNIITMMSTVNLTILYTERQTAIDKTELANVVSISTMFILCAFPVGAYLSSVLTEYYNVTQVIFFASCYLMALSVLFLIYWLVLNRDKLSLYKA